MASKEDTAKNKWEKARKISHAMGVFKEAIENKTSSTDSERPSTSQSAPPTARSTEANPVSASPKWKSLQTKLLLNAELRAPIIELNGEAGHPTAPRIDLPPSRPPSARSNFSHGISSRSNSYSSRSSRQGLRPSSAYSYVTPPPKPPVKEKSINLKERFGITTEELEPVGMDKMNSFKYIHILFKIWEPQLCKSYRPSAVYTPPPKKTRSRRRRHDKYSGGLAAFLDLHHISRKFSTSSMKSTGSDG